MASCCCWPRLSGQVCCSQFGVNHLGHFLLTNLLLPLLTDAASRGEPARVVNLSSRGHYLFAPEHGISLDDLDGAKSYDPWRRYGESKLANVLHAKEISRRCADVSAVPAVVAVSVHPGGIPSTELGRHIDFGAVLSLLLQPAALFAVLFTAKRKSVPEGAATTLHAALAPDVVAGGYYADCQLEETVVHPRASDSDLTLRLWEASERAVASAQAKLADVAAQ